MLKLLQLSVLLLTMSTLGACTSLPNGKFSPSFQDYPIKTHLVKKEYDTPLNITIPQMANSSGSLIGAVIVGVANGVSASKRSQGKSEILGSFSGKDYHEFMGNTFVDTIKQADIIDSQEYNIVRSAGHRAGKDAFDTLTETSEQQYMTQFYSYAYIGEFYQNLTHSVYMKIDKKDEKQNVGIFQLVLHETFVPNEITDTKSLENYRFWTKNDNALIKKGLQETTQRLEAELKTALLDSTIVK